MWPGSRPPPHCYHRSHLQGLGLGGTQDSDACRLAVDGLDARHLLLCGVEAAL